MAKYILFVLMFMVVIPAQAQEASATPSPSVSRTASPSPRVKELREAAKTEIEDAKAEAKDEIQQARGDLKDKITEVRQAFKDQLKKIKDKTKQTIAGRIEDNIYKLNARLTSKFNDILDTLSVILVRIEARARKASTDGQDVTAVVTSIQKAKIAINTAGDLVQAQSTKSYAITISSDKTARQDFSKIRKIFHDDIVKVRDAVVEARTAVRNAALALAEAVGEPLRSPSLTPSGTPEASASPIASPSVTP